ncbi:hypothetical protein H8957_009551 [Semnopithecus entellus]
MSSFGDPSFTLQISSPGIQYPYSHSAIARGWGWLFFRQLALPVITAIKLGFPVPARKRRGRPGTAHLGSAGYQAPPPPCLWDNALEDLRVDGRGCEDYRCVEVETDVVSNTSGSARVKLGHTDILVGVKAEMGTPKLEKPNEGYLEFFVDCSANATPEFEGRGGDDLGTEIANTLYRIFNNKSSVDLKTLCISPREHCWVLYVDVLLLECGGNLFDAISIAVKAALFNTSIPRVQVLEDEEGSKDIELSDDPYDCIRLSVENVPCIVTLCKIGYRHVVDATLQEEACSLASLLVSVTSKGVVTCMRKVGKGSLDPESIFEMMETGKRVGKVLHASLQSVLHKEESLGPKRQKVGFLG